MADEGHEDGTVCQKRHIERIVSQCGRRNDEVMSPLQILLSYITIKEFIKRNKRKVVGKKQHTNGKTRKP